jgi:hypothetical protein
MAARRKVQMSSTGKLLILLKIVPTVSRLDAGDQVLLISTYLSRWHIAKCLTQEYQ